MEKTVRFGKYVVRFTPHTLGAGVHGHLTTRAGYVLSIVGGFEGLYGNGVSTFEVMVMDERGEMVGDDVHGWLTVDEVAQLATEYDE